MKIKTGLSLAISITFFLACKTDSTVYPDKYKTQNVIIILIDGPRYSETWGDTLHQYIPGLEAISKQGVICTNFYNDSVTFTVNGHTAISTGFYQGIDNSGLQYPNHVGLFQSYLKTKKVVPSNVWIISSKDKIEVLGNCTDPDYSGKYTPSHDCGVNGLHTGYREDSVTYLNALRVLSKDHPHLAFIGFKEPDSKGHQNDWPGYLNGLILSDSYTYKIWQFLQNDPTYKDNTTVFITNDHGRHLDGVADGFVSHGDDCEGCKHIMLLATGPDFKRNAVVTKHYGLVDINATVAELLGLKTEGAGVVMKELFN
jgi:membrane-anchored protein YejM (alkaline phosphatase superfamily)